MTRTGLASTGVASPLANLFACAAWLALACLAFLWLVVLPLVGLLTLCGAFDA